MDNQDIRWKQRFANFEKAFHQLEKFIEKGHLNEFEEQGLIKSFDYTYELGWKVMKDIFEYQGERGILGSRDAIKLAFNRDLISDGEVWANMIEDRIKSVHTYDEKMADDLAFKIQSEYFNSFKIFYNKVKTLV